MANLSIGVGVKPPIFLWSERYAAAAAPYKENKEHGYPFDCSIDYHHESPNPNPESWSFDPLLQTALPMFIPRNNFNNREDFNAVSVFSICLTG